MYTTMCTIEADLDELCKSLKPRTASDTTGKETTFYRADFEIALLFGMTEFKALIIWKGENVSRLPVKANCALTMCCNSNRAKSIGNLLQSASTPGCGLPNVIRSSSAKVKFNPEDTD